MSLLQVCVWDQCGVIYKIQLLQGFLFCLIRTISFLEFLCTNSLCAFIRKGKVEFRMKGRKNFFVVSVYSTKKTNTIVKYFVCSFAKVFTLQCMYSEVEKKNFFHLSSVLPTFGYLTDFSFHLKHLLHYSREIKVVNS